MIEPTPLAGDRTTFSVARLELPGQLPDQAHRIGKSSTLAGAGYPEERGLFRHAGPPGRRPESPGPDPSPQEQGATNAALAEDLTGPAHVITGPVVEVRHELRPGGLPQGDELGRILGVRR